MLKGATALLARLDSARHSKDVDLAWQAKPILAEAEQSLRRAAAYDSGDFFSFQLSDASPLVGDKGLRFPAAANLGVRPFVKFSIDIVAGHRLTDVPELVAPLVDLDIPGLLRVEYPVYPLVDHIADKVAACMERHDRQDGSGAVSTRYKDLVDLVLIAVSQRPKASMLRSALLAEAARRGVPLHAEFTVPGPLWPAGYEALAAQLPRLAEIARFPAALALVKRMLDPVLRSTATGTWNPERQVWSG